MCRRLKLNCLFLAGALFVPLAGHAQDKIVTKTGTLTGEITGVAADGSPLLNSAKGKEKVPKADIIEIQMRTPEAVVTARKAVEVGDWAAVEGAVKAPVAAFKGLQADWVIEALGLLADAQLAQKKNDEAKKTCDEITANYAGTPYADKAKVGLARLAIAQAEGANRDAKLTEASRLLQPITASGDAVLMPDAARQRILADAFFAQGQLQEAKGQKAEALESYCKVIALYPCLPTLTAQAKGRADAIRADGTIFVK